MKEILKFFYNFMKDLFNIKTNYLKIIYYLNYLRFKYWLIFISCLNNWLPCQTHCTHRMDKKNHIYNNSSLLFRFETGLYRDFGYQPTVDYL